jgi:protein-S-isoprenylcysteine O-methyltransferase Ste14
MTVYVLAAACAVLLVVIAGRLVKKAKRASDDEAADGPTSSFTGAMLSALFLLAFAIAIVVPWTTTDAARLNTYSESEAVVEGAWSASRLPAPYGDRIVAELRGYVEQVRGPEWRQMADGRMTGDGWARLESLRREVTGLPLKGDDQEEVRAAVLDHIAEISAARRQRAMDAKATPPPGLLVVTVVTGLIVLLFPFLSGSRPRGMSLVPLALMAALLGVGVWLCFDISHAFSGALAVKPDAFDAVMSELGRITGSA